MLRPEPGAFYVMDRGYLDFARLYRLHQAGAFFVVRAKSQLAASRRLYSRHRRSLQRLICDQTVRARPASTRPGSYPDRLRRIRFTRSRDRQDAWSSSPTTSRCRPATIAELYRCRWQVELFFKWIKQHLRIKAFFGTSENAVKTQIWIAISVYVLVAILKKRLALSASLYTILQMLSVTIFEKIQLNQLLLEAQPTNQQLVLDKQLNLFDD